MRITSTEIGVLILLGLAGWYGWTHYELPIKQKLGLAPVPKVRVLDAQFKCDSRIYCSQMTSCEETRFFKLVALPTYSTSPFERSKRYTPGASGSVR